MAKSKKDPNFPMQGKGGGMGGKYARKAENLTAKELKAAGGAKAAKARTVSISDTKRLYGKGITVGPGGKPLTGSVRLENGNMAVYKDGKRVVKAAKPKPAAPSRPSAGSSSSRAASNSSPAKPTPAKPTPAKPAAGKPDKPAKPNAKPNAKPAASGQTAAQKAAASAVANINYRPTAAAPKKPSPGRQYKPIAVSGPTAMPQKDPGPIPGISGTKPKPPAPTRSRRVGSSIVTEAYVNGKWVVRSTRRA